MNEATIKVFESFAANCRVMAARAEEEGWTGVSLALRNAARAIEAKVRRWGKREDDGEKTDSP